MIAGAPHAHPDGSRPAPPLAGFPESKLGFDAGDGEGMPGFGGWTTVPAAQGQGGDYLIPGVDSPLWQTLNVSETMRRSSPALS